MSKFGKSLKRIGRAGLVAGPLGAIAQSVHEGAKYAKRSIYRKTGIGRKFMNPGSVTSASVFNNVYGTTGSIVGRT